MVTGVSAAELTVILVDARNGVVEQTRRHAAIAVSRSTEPTAPNGPLAAVPRLPRRAATTVPRARCRHLASVLRVAWEVRRTWAKVVSS